MRVFRLPVLLSLVALAIGRDEALGAESAGRRASAHVTYLAGGSVYVDAGRLDGIAEGDTLTLERESATIGRLRVAFVASHRAACDTLAMMSPPRLGDVVTFLARPPEPSSARGAPGAATAIGDSGAARDSSPAAPSGRAARSGAGPALVRGRIGARLLWIDAATGAAGDLRQPALDLRLDGPNLGGSGLDLGLDVRARRSTRTLSDGSLSSENFTRVYRASLSLHDASSRRRMTLGRQSSPTLASVSVFDGALIEVGVRALTIGAFSGTQPDPANDGFSGEVLEHGAFLALRRARENRRFGIAVGAVTSRSRGELNRDFLFVQADGSNGRAFGSFAQEFDVNSGWKRAMGEEGFVPTSTFLIGQYRVRPYWTLRTGYDTRRNVRLWRDHETPATQFDDRYRTGGWLGTALDAGSHVRLDADVRLRSGDANDRSHTLSIGGELYRLPLRGLTLRARGSSFESDRTTSRLATGSLSIQPWQAGHLELECGERSTNDELAGGREVVSWIGFDGDVAFSRRWYLATTIEQNRGGVDDLVQAMTALSWRF